MVKDEPMMEQIDILKKGRSGHMNIQLKWFYRLGFLLLLFIVVYIFIKLKLIWAPILKIIMLIIEPFIISAFITYLLHPIVKKLQENYFPRWLAILIIYLLFFGGVGLAIYKGIPAFVHQIRELADNIPSFVQQYRNWIHLIQEQTSTWPEGVQEKIDLWIDEGEERLESILSNVIDWFVQLLNSLVLIALIPFIVFYMLKDFDQMKKALWYITPKKWRKSGIKFLRDLDHSLGGYIRGQIFVCAAIGTCSAVLYWLIDMKYPLLLGFIAGVTNIIPYFGPFIGMVPVVIIAATISAKMVIYSILIGLGLQFLESHILSPFIMGKSLKLHPLLIMLALFAGGEAGGIIGLIFAVPFLVILKVTIVHAKNSFSKSQQMKENQL